MKSATIAMPKDVPRYVREAIHSARRAVHAVFSSLYVSEGLAAR